MRIAIMGAGGLGGAIGGLLARAGEDVSFVARGAHLEAIRSRGLTLKSPGVDDVTMQVMATDDPAEVGPVDLIVFGVKLYDLEVAAEQMRPMIGPETVILPIQNGIDAAERIGQFVRPNAVIGCTALLNGRIEAPGVIFHLALPSTLTFGELVGGASPRIEGIQATFEHAGFRAEVPPDVRVPIWEKFVLQVGGGGVMAMTRLTAGPIRTCPETRDLLHGVFEETAAVGRASGVSIPSDCVDRHMALMDHIPPTAQGSMLTDLLGGRRLELESLGGTVVRLGRDFRVPTPLNFAVYAALKPYVHGTPARP
jgi:2-dehydropantoate 2-reductase